MSVKKRFLFYTNLSRVFLLVVDKVNSVQAEPQIVMCDPLSIVLSSLCRNSYDNNRLTKVNLWRKTIN